METGENGHPGRKSAKYGGNVWKGKIDMETGGNGQNDHFRPFSCAIAHGGGNGSKRAPGPETAKFGGNVWKGK